MPTGPKTTLILEQYTSVSNGRGGFTQTWQSKRAIIGVLSALSDRERFMYGKKAEDASLKFTIDFPNGLTITTKDRFVSTTGDRVLDITSKEDPMNQHRTLIFFLSEKPDG